MIVHGALGSINQARVIGEAQIIVGAQVHHAVMVGALKVDTYPTGLRRGDHALTLIQPLIFDVVQCGRDMI